MAAVHEGPIAEKILNHLGLPTQLPVLAPAQTDPQGGRGLELTRLRYTGYS